MTTTSRKTTIGVLAASGILALAMAQQSWAAEHLAAEGAAPETSTNFQDLKREWGEAIETLKGYSVKQRDKAVAQGRQTLKAMDERLDKMEARAAAQWGELSTETREKRQAALRDLREQRNRLAEWYGGMQHSSADAWEEVKKGFAAAYERLSDSMGQAMDEFDDSEGER